MAGFEDLEVWRRAVALSADVYRRLAKCSDYGFRDQVTRSALSIPSSIAEGMERSSTPDRAKFLDYARGSCGAFRTQAVVGTKAGFVESTVSDVWINESREISAMIQGLIRSLKTSS